MNCPNCGYCPHCGRSGQRTLPYVPSYPYPNATPWYPSYPYTVTVYGGGFATQNAQSTK